MKKVILSSLLAVGLVSSAMAAPVGDLIIGFRDTTSGSNVTFDLGAASLFQTGGTYAAGGSIDTGINVGSLLSSTYGAGYTTDTGLFWGVVGATATGNTLFASANSSSTVADGSQNSTPWAARTSTSQSAQKSKFTTVGNNTTTGGSSVVAASVSTSWTTLEGTSPTQFAAYTKPLFESVSGAGVADLYVNAPTVAGAFLGNVSIGGNGDVFFTTIPEPSTYAAILGVATLGFAALRRRKQAQLVA